MPVNGGIGDLNFGGMNLGPAPSSARPPMGGGLVNLDNGFASAETRQKLQDTSSGPPMGGMMGGGPAPRPLPPMMGGGGMYGGGMPMPGYGGK